MALIWDCVFVVSGQTVFTMQISAPDTASSIFSQNKCIIQSSEFIPLDPETELPLYQVKVCSDSSFLSVKFPNKDWIMVRELIQLPNYSPPCGFMQGMMGYDYINLLPIYTENTGILEAVMSGSNVQIRYKLYISVNDDPYYYMYSNIETMYLPPATPDDINGLLYLRSHIQRVRGFSYLSDTDNYKPEVWVYLRDNFPNSIISDLASHYAIGDEYRTKRDAEGQTPTLNQWYRNRLATLLNTKSDLLKAKLLGHN